MQAQETGTVYATTNYKQFKFLPGNRPIDHALFEDLTEKVRTKNLLRENPIVIDQYMNVLDGQHRLKVAELLCLPIWYIVSHIMEPEDIGGLNVTRRTWKLEDYLHFFVTRDKGEYKILNDFLDGHKSINLSDAINLCHFPNGDGKVALRRKFMEGKYIANNMGHAEKMAAMLLDFKPYLPKHHKQRVFVMAIEHLVADPRYDHEHMKGKLELVGYRLEPRTSTADYFPLLNEVYNWKAREGSRVEFTFRKPSRKRKVHA